jgi:hypothetical protein
MHIKITVWRTYAHNCRVHTLRLKTKTNYIKIKKIKAVPVTGCGGP